VARLAGVSQATVSYVINDAPTQKIPDSTRVRVLEAARALGYAPSVHARALRRGRSEHVLLLLPDWPIGPALAELIDTLTRELAAHALALLVHPASSPIAELWRALMPAGVISLDPIPEHEAAELRRAGIALATTTHESRPAPQAALVVPHDSIGRLQVAHLAATGHRRLGYAAPSDPRLRAFLVPRLKGARAECRRLRLPAPAVARMSLDAGAARTAVLSWRETEVTAVCAYNDEIAFAVLAGARGAGVAVPSQLAVIGVDDVPLAPFALPPLTTIRFDFATTARHLTAVVAAGIRGGDPPPPPGPSGYTLVTRESG
jgi:DNA-binding LacI/PurR family transcriptional regulator